MSVRWGWRGSSIGLSHTETQVKFLTGRMERAGVQSEFIEVVNYEIPRGTYSDMEDGDQWPGIPAKVLASDIIVFATPIWWSSQSSLMPRTIERFDELHDYVTTGKPSGLEGKSGGIVITGDSDGAQTAIGNLCNFF
jgi:multimeric flavodoxin WrbA